MKKLFGKINMTWKKVIFFSAAAGIFTGLINQVPLLKDTSFRDIAICFEWWILFAVVIAVNCKKPLESGLKVFIFFLISQPLVFLVETPFQGTQVWGYYRYWFILTLLTFPGGMLANLVKRKNVLSTLILSIALCLLGMEFVNHSLSAIVNFPRHLLSAIVSLALIILFIKELIDKNSLRALAAGITAVVCIAIAAFALTAQSSSSVELPEIGDWSYSLESEAGCRVEVGERSFTYYFNRYLSTSNEIKLTNEKGTSVTYKVEPTAGGTAVNITEK